MAKYASLAALFEAIADAIRSKTGSTADIVAENFPEEIAKITAGSSESTVMITPDNISKYFDVVNSSYYFVGSGYTFTSNNGGVNSSTAQTTLTALFDMDMTFEYSYSSEASYDKFTLIVGSTTVANGLSGSTTTKTYSGTITAGTVLTFQYAKDSSKNSNDDKCTFGYMMISGIFTTT